MPDPFPRRLVWPSLASGAILVLVSAATGVALYRQQTDVAALLAENLGSRRAAADLNEALTDLQLVVHDRGDRVGGLTARIDGLLDAVHVYANQPDEVALADAVAASFDRYRTAWAAVPASRRSPGYDAAVNAAEAVLAGDTTRRCAELVEYNSRRVEQSAADHRRVLRGLAWGLGGVGVTGAVAGLVAGYGAARWVRRSVHRLQVQVRDAAGKLGTAGPEIVVTGEGDLAALHAQMGQLVAQVEQTVGRLQAREREVLRAEQLAAVGQLAAGVAHEVRNPLTAIKMLVQVGLAAGTPFPPEDLAVIEREVRRMERSLQTFLDFARLPTPDRVRCDVTAVLDRTLDLVRGRAARQGVAVTAGRPPGGVWLTADPDQLQQVFVNLAMNALDEMPAGGELVVTPAGTAGGGAVVTVADTGPGVAPAVLPRLFTPFVSNKETGLGLGLVLSKRIVEDHGGTLTAANRPGGGAEFTVSLGGG